MYTHLTSPRSIFMVLLISFHQSKLFLQSKAGKAIVTRASEQFSNLTLFNWEKSGLGTRTLNLHSLHLLFWMQIIGGNTVQSSHCAQEIQVTLGRDKRLPANLFSGKRRAGTFLAALRHPAIINETVVTYKKRRSQRPTAAW